MTCQRLWTVMALLLASGTVGGVAVAAAEAPAAPQAFVRGIGGVFFKVDDPVEVGDWYRRNFGVDVGAAGFAHFLWRDAADPAVEHRTVWSPFPRSSDYFGDGDQQFMINYIVDDLDGFLAHLAANGVRRVGDIEAFDYGRFAWVIDVAGNRVELWEPVVAE